MMGSPQALDYTAQAGTPGTDRHGTGTQRGTDGGWLAQAQGGNGKIAHHNISPPERRLG